MTQLSIHQASDIDWFKFELPRSDDLHFQLSFPTTGGSLQFGLFDANGNQLAASVATSNGAELTVTSLPAGAYTLEVFGDGNTNQYGLNVTPAATSLTRVFYVNDASVSNDYYSLAVGDSANDGLSAEFPKASIQDVLGNYVVGPNDLIAVDTGVYGGSVTVVAEDEGATYVGTPAGSTLLSSFTLSDADFNSLRRLRFAGSGGTVVIAKTEVDSSTDNLLDALTFEQVSYGVQINGGSNNVIDRTSIVGPGGYGVLISDSGSATVRRSSIHGMSYGGYAAYEAVLDVQDSQISESNYGLYATGDYMRYGTIHVLGSELSQSQYGAYAIFGRLFVQGANRIHDNAVGVRGENVSQVVVNGNEIFGNEVGLQGFGQFGGQSWTNSNSIQNNGIGIDAAAGQDIAFNELKDNQTAIVAGNSATVHNNLLVDNGNGVLVSGSTGLSIYNNTIVATTGTAIRVQNGSQNVALRNNIVSVNTGFGVYVATDSQAGFTSDYNNLYSSGGAAIVWWQKPFYDLFDWQVEADFDSHSIGFTVLAPLRDQPKFVDPVTGDYRLQLTSTSIDSGQPSDLFSNEPAPNGGRIDLGAYGNTILATPNSNAMIRMEYPEYYTDWPATEGRPILWRTYDPTGPSQVMAGLVDITLEREGFGQVAHIATVPANQGVYGWSPQSSGIAGSLDHRYRIKVALQGSTTIHATSREPFSVPTAGGSYYVNDASLVAGDLTVAVGNNRNTGLSPSSPKANLLPILRSYDLGPADTVYIDAGDYINVRNVVISGNLTQGNDEGLTITGPSDPSRIAILNRANPYPSSTNIELTDADFVTLRHLTLSGASTGLWVRNGSTNFNGHDLTTSSNTRNGITIESDSFGTVVDRLTAINNGDTGISIKTPISSLSNSLVHSNGSIGIALNETGNTAVESNTVYNNGLGIQVFNQVFGTTTIGNANLALGRGNKVYSNYSGGIYAWGNVSVVGNTVWGQSGGGYGIDVVFGSIASHNVVYANTFGIISDYYYSSANEISNNRVFGNAETGIVTNLGTTVRGNVVYSNRIGIDAIMLYNKYSGLITNNLVYANSTTAIRVDGAGPLIINNTLYQPTGNAIDVQSQSSGIQLRNNIIWSMSGYALTVPATSQVGFGSDFNLFQTGLGGQVALWQGVPRATLNAWQNTVFNDQNSLQQPPLFVDVDGADGVLGYSFGTSINYGDDDDFHLQSLHGSFHGGSLAPRLSPITGLPIPQVGALTIDAASSPAIDRGGTADVPVNEPANNGGYVNLGTYGNTSQASKSPSAYVMVTRPDGGDIWPAGQTFPIRWRSNGFSGNVSVELWRASGSAAAAVVVEDTLNDGEYLWTIPNALSPASDYEIRIYATSNPALIDTSNFNFEITPPVHVYYVNDGSTVGDEVPTAIGDNANTGLSRSQPKASIAAVLEAYDLEPGDVIKVEVGDYVLDGNIIIGAEDSGVRIEGPSAGVALLNRNNTSFGSYVFDLQAATDVTLARLSMTGASYGVYAEVNAGSNDATITESRVFENTSGNIEIRQGNLRATVSGNRIYNTPGSGISSAGESASIVANVIYGNGYGVYSTGGKADIADNDIYNNSLGIVVYNYNYGTGLPSFVRDNRVHNNEGTGIQANYFASVERNVVWGHALGIDANLGASTLSNVVFDNQVGIVSTYPYDGAGPILNNRVYRNSSVGISATFSTQVSGNTVYGNAIGIDAHRKSGYPYTGEIIGNIVYGNLQLGIQVQGLNAVVRNNTVHQTIGNAIELNSSSSGINLRNNILASTEGYAITVQDDSQGQFDSDFNNFFLSGTGKIASWQGRDFSNLTDWNYEVGADKQSQTGNPLFVDVDGADGVSGFSYDSVAGATRIIDDGDIGFSTTGSWDSSIIGYEGDSLTDLEDGTATYTFNGLEPNGWYKIAITWPDDAPGTFGNATIRSSGVRLASLELNQFQDVSDFSADGATWKDLGLYYVEGDNVSVSLSNNYPQTYFLTADAVRLERIVGNRGADDNFQVQVNSPTLDAGDPSSEYLREPFPNGGRINVGYTGNTSLAVPSQPSTIQVLSPNGREKFEVGSPVTIQWQSSGLSQQQIVGRWNSGGGELEGWAIDRYLEAYYSNTHSSVIDTSGILEPAPESVYQSVSYSSYGVGSSLKWHLPVSDGSYALRLHFIEPDFNGAGTRVMDVVVQGSTAVSGYDIFAAAGALYKATDLTVPATAAGGTGIDVELRSVTDWPSIVSGIELIALNPTGNSNPTADVDVSLDNGVTWAPIASSVAMDLYGRGSLTWTPTLESSAALIRVRANQFGHPEDRSNNSFLLSNSGADYYVNDVSQVGDLLTTAVGNNANTGKSPGSPMSSLAALLAAYDLDAGDVIHVDAGQYSLLRNIVIGSGDAGVRIEGPALGTALLDRGNTNTSSYGIELQGASGVTLVRLGITGGNFGVYAGDGSDSDDLTVLESEIFANNSGNIHLLQSNDRPVIMRNRSHTSNGSGILVAGVLAQVVENRVWSNHYGIEIHRDGNVSENRVFNNAYGVYAATSGSLGLYATVIENNQIHNNTNTGVTAYYSTLVQDNEIWANQNGIDVNFGAVANRNVVFDNAMGIFSSYPYAGAGAITNNRVFHNSLTGIYATYATPVTGNVVFENSIGIEAKNAYSGLYVGEIQNNVVYGNSNAGIRVSSSGASITNNTIYQSVGNALHVTGRSSSTRIRNNILYSESGFNLYVDDDSQVGFSSDYNQFFYTGSGQLGHWQGRDFSNLTDWNYEVGADKQSQTGNPLFVDVDGADGVSGFSYDSVAGATRIIDDGDIGFSTTGSWDSSIIGYEGDSLTDLEDGTATYTFNGLEPNGWYKIAITWPDDAPGTFGNATIRSSGVRLASLELNQFQDVSDFSADGATWKDLGLYYVEGDNVSVSLSNNYPQTYFLTADAVRLERIVGNRGADDNFQVQVNSPTLDAGDPSSEYLREPFPNGGRINVGYTGNTSLAVPSQPSTIQVLSPNGREKFEVGSPVTIQWQSSGLSQQQIVGRWNSGGGELEGWAIDRYLEAYYSNTHSSVIDTSGILEPAPESVYQSVSYSSYGVGSSLKWHLPVSDGSYALRLHFIEPDYYGAGTRVMDVVVQGSTAVSGYDIFAAAGALYKATDLTVPATAAGGTGIDVELRSVTDWPSIVSGIELIALNPTGNSNPTADVDVSLDNGVTWAPIASSVAMDLYGRGSLTWTPTLESSAALIRVRANQFGHPEDRSNNSFLLSNSGADYYVNDVSQVGDLLTTAVGNNANTGKSPGSPMSSLAALLAAYDLDAGDVIHVDAGQYSLLRNIVIGSGDAGVRIEGPALGTALLDRGNTNASSFGIELQGASDVTLQRLSITGGEIGVFGGDGWENDDFILEDSKVFENLVSNVQIGNVSERAIIRRNEIYGAYSNGIRVDGGSAHVASNTIHTNGIGLEITGLGTTVESNEVYSNADGIRYIGGSRDGVASLIIGNNVHHNTSIGIRTSYAVTIESNRVWNNSYGIDSTLGGIVSKNEVFANVIGINATYYFGGADLISRNRVYLNSIAGIHAVAGTVIDGNTVYSNSTGIDAVYSGIFQFSGTVSNNLVYANSNLGVRVQSDGAKVINNTVYQSVGNALHVDGNSRNTIVRNNILWVEAGFDIFVASDSQSGFSSDYNLLFTGTDPNAMVGFWMDSAVDTLQDWRLASGGDVHSPNGDPDFVDIDGADNVLGYSTLGNGYDGGLDDNFYQVRLSPAIDSGDAWFGTSTDILGLPRVDDPGVINSGTPAYQMLNLGASNFAEVGTGIGYQSYQGAIELNFSNGFQFPFYGTQYERVIISGAGFLYFEGSMSTADSNNSLETLRFNRMIAPLWDGLTNPVGNDIYVSQSPTNVTIRWSLYNANGLTPVNFSVTLHVDGKIDFHYGAGNTDLSPTIGISSGTGDSYLLSSYDGQNSLSDANSIQFALNPQGAYTDIGAYEFRGNSNDATPPSIVAITPAFVGASASSGLIVNQLSVRFSEELNFIDANAAANYELRRAVNGIFGDQDDVIYSISPSYQFSAATLLSQVDLNLGIGGQPLPAGQYRFTVRGGATASIHDTAGLRLDGNTDGLEGPDYIRFFSIVAPGISITSNDTEVSETGDSAQFSVVLDAQPTADVTIYFDSSDLSEGVLNKSSVTFTHTNWNVPQVVTLLGVDDTLDDGDIALQVIVQAAVSSDSRYNGLDAADLMFANLDNDQQALTISAAVLSVDEGGSNSVVVALAAQPLTDVVVTVSRSSGDGDLGLVGGNQLIFNSANWNVPQTIYIEAAEDIDVSAGTATFSVSSPGLETQIIQVSEVDNDVQTLVVSTSSVSVNEGGSANFMVKLSNQPSGNVVVNVQRASGDSDLNLSGASSLTFTPANWNVNQTVLLSAAEDADVANGSAIFDVSSAGVATVSVTATEVDNDVQTLVVSPLSVSVNEGGSASFTVRLSNQPSGNVVVNLLRASGDSDLSLSGASSLTFTPANWNVNQTVLLSAAEDADVANGSAIFDVSSTGVATVSVTATEVDNDVQTLVVSPLSVSVNEGGSASFTVRLSNQPSGNVVVNLLRASGDSDLSLSGASSLTFTPANWNVNQTVLLSAAEDADVANGSATFDVSSAGVATVSVTATEVDNDAQTLVVSPLSVLVNEGGSASFTVRLLNQPSGNVVVNIQRASGDSDLNLSGASSLTFTPANWNVNQTVGVSAAEDVDVANGSATFDVSSAGIATVSVTATEVDNDAQTLVVSPLSVSVNEGGSASFSVRLSNQPSGNVVVNLLRASGDSDLNLSGASSLTFTPANWNVNQTVLLSAAEDADVANGSAIFDVSSAGVATVSVTATEATTM